MFRVSVYLSGSISRDAISLYLVRDFSAQILKCESVLLKGFQLKGQGHIAGPNAEEAEHTFRQYRVEAVLLSHILQFFYLTKINY